jgi:hypothetical protein
MNRPAKQSLLHSLQTSRAVHPAYAIMLLHAGPGCTLLTTSIMCVHQKGHLTHLNMGYLLTASWQSLLVDSWICHTSE